MTPGWRERGSISVEFALVTPALVLVLAAALGVAAWTSAQVRATDTASAAVRLALTEGAAGAERALRAPGVSVDVVGDGSWWRATVVVGTQGPLPDARSSAGIPVQP
jgi:Flp pilus assembly protein TadG